MSLRSRSWLRLAVSASLAVLPSTVPAGAHAQRPAPDTLAVRPVHRIDIFGRHDALMAAAFALGTLAVMPLDRHIAVESQRPSLQNNSALEHTTTAFRVLGEPGSIVLAGVTYIYGRTERSPRSAEIGLRTLESIGVAGLTTYVIKGIAGRARPYVVSDTNPVDYSLGGGFRDDGHTSFPSGHVTTAFAAASTASDEISYLWPHASQVWTPLLFTTASLVGVARIYENKHWASDVVAGAAVGIVMSRVVIRYSRAHPRNSIDRLLLPAAAANLSRAPPTSFSWNFQW